MPGEPKKFEAKLQGQVTLSVLRVNAEGVAEVEVTSTGRGTTGPADQPVPFDTQPPAPMTVTIAPTGVISDLRVGGQRTSLLADDGDDLFNASRLVRGYAIGTYTFFGLQLPEKHVASGASWRGTHQIEEARYEGPAAEERNPKDATITLTPHRVTLTYEGPTILEGRPCHLILPTRALHLNDPASSRTSPAATGSMNKPANSSARRSRRRTWEDERQACTTW